MRQNNQFKRLDNLMSDDDYRVSDKYADQMQRLINNAALEDIPAYTWIYVNDGYNINRAIEFYGIAEQLATNAEWDDTVHPDDKIALRHAVEEFGKTFTELQILNECIDVGFPENVRSLFTIIANDDLDLIVNVQCDTKTLQDGLQTIYNINPNAAFIFAFALSETTKLHIEEDKDYGLPTAPLDAQRVQLAQNIISQYMQGKDMMAYEARTKVLTDTCQETQEEYMSNPEAQNHNEEEIDE